MRPFLNYVERLARQARLETVDVPLDADAVMRRVARVVPRVEPPRETEALSARWCAAVGAAAGAAACGAIVLGLWVWRELDSCLTALVSFQSVGLS